MAVLLILPLAVFALVMLFAGCVVVSVEFGERRRARRRIPQARPLFHPVVIEGGLGKTELAGQRRPADTAVIKLVRSAPH